MKHIHCMDDDTKIALCFVRRNYVKLIVYDARVRHIIYTSLCKEKVT
jgi:hypothetical protein